MMDEPTHSARSVTEMRLVITAADYEQVVSFYRDVLGLAEREAFSDHGRGVVLEAGVATLEILDEQHAVHVDAVEVGRRVAGTIRLALEVADVAATTERAMAAGANLIAAPTRTPWESTNSRLDAPGGLQLTLFSDAG